MFVEIEHEGLSGIGEASMVPYKGENFESASSFLEKLDLTWIKTPFNFAEIRSYLESVSFGSTAIKAAVDIALHDLQGKLDGKPCYSYFGSLPENMPLSSITIGIDTPEVIIKKVHEAEMAKVLKVKLGSEDDKALIKTIRSVTDKPLYVDANQGWNDRVMASEMVFWLEEQGVVLVEQPMNKDDLQGNAWLTERSPIPIIADEAVHRLEDMELIKDAYHGINVKLMKCGGMHEAYEMIQRAKALDLKVLIGCMSETSVATLAGISLAPLCDWADLDGSFLTSNNPFGMPDFVDGKWILLEGAGLGVGVTMV